MAWLRILLTLALTICATASHAQVVPASPATPPPSSEQLRAVIGTLENDAERQKLVDQLKQLLAAQQAVQKPLPTEHGGAARIISGLSDRVERVSGALVDGATVLIDTPRLSHWLQAQLADPQIRARWIAIAWKVVLVLVAGVAAEMVTRALLARARRAVEARTSESIWVRIVYLLAWAVLDIAPLAALAAAAYFVLPLLEPVQTTRLIALALVNAIVLARGVTTLAQLLFMPRVAGLRVLPLGAEDATYIYVWLRRLTYVAVYGWVLAETALLLGLPSGGHQALVKIVGVVFALLVVVLILQARQPVAAWLGGRLRDKTAPSRGWRALRDRLADIWHVLAVLYVIGLYVVWALDIKNGFDYVGRASLLSVVILVGARLLAQAVREGLEGVFSISDDLKRRYPGLESRANRYLAVLESVAVAAVYVVAVFAALAAWGLDSLGWLGGELGRRFAGRVILISALIIGTVVLWELINGYIERTLTRDGRAHIGPRARTLLPLARSVALIVLTTLAVFTVLSEIGLDIGPLLAGAGVIGLAVGFGSQTLVKDIVTGVFILTENQVAVGDVIRIGTHAGQVEAITIRTIRLRDGTGTVHIIPFSEVQTIENQTRDFSRFVFNVRISHREDVDDVIATLKEIGAEMQTDPEYARRMIGSMEVLGVDQFDDNAVIILSQITTRPNEQAPVGREFNRRMKKKFDEKGIEMASHRRTIYFGASREGEASPARVRIEDGTLSTPDGRGI